MAVEMRRKISQHATFLLCCAEGRYGGSGEDVLAMPLLYEFLADGWHFYLEKEEQPWFSDCCSVGHLVSEFF